MKIKIDFYDRGIANTINSDFPFHVIHNIMNATGWRYYTDPHNSPSISKIKSMLYGLIDGIKPKYDGSVESYNASCGGFDVERCNDCYQIKFNIASYHFSDKSYNWSSEDMEFYRDFIDKIRLTFEITGSLFRIHSYNDSIIHFKRRCDEFIDSNKDYDYDKKLGVLFVKEQYTEEGVCLYTLSFIGVDKEYQL